MITKFTILIIFLSCSLGLYAQDVNGFVSLTEIAPIGVSKDTGDKPQSKTWSYNCSYWAVLPDSEGTHLFRLDGTRWTKILTFSKTAYKADCKVVGNIAHVFLFRGKDVSQLASLEYVPKSNTYKFWSKRQELVDIKLEEDTNTASIDVDSEGKMWLVSDSKSCVNARWSDEPYLNWSTPIELACGITDEDISAVIAMPNKIGVIWSNQNTNSFGFRTHVDGTPPNNWTPDEGPKFKTTPLEQEAPSNAYINAAVGKDGTLYCGVKVEYNINDFPRISLLVRHPTGIWDDYHEVSKTGSRPLVILNEEVGKLKVIYTTSVIDGNDIVYKESPLSKINFSPQMTLLKGPLNDATSSKENYSSGAIILASNSKQAIGIIGSDGVEEKGCKEFIEWQIYPNPFSKRTTVHFTMPENGEFTLSLYDNRGRKLNELKKGYASAGEEVKIEIDANKLAKGLYYVRLQTNSELKGSKVVIDK